MESRSSFRRLVLVASSLLLLTGCGAESSPASDDAGSLGAPTSTPAASGLDSGVSAHVPFLPVNVNLASASTLAGVPGIGTALAARIVDARSHGHLFSNPADIANVPGIGATSVQGMLPWIVAKIDVNSATQSALEALPEIGEARAKDILAWRNAHGSFQTIAELAQVPGLSASIAADIAPYVKATHVEPNPGCPLVDVNDADLDVLEALPGLGYVKSSAIIRWRNEHGLFKHVDDLLDVPGIGPETLEGIRHLVTTSNPSPMVGTFAVEGTWSYDDGQGGVATGRFPRESLDFTLAEGYAGPIAVINGICDGTDCQPIALTVAVTSQAPNEDFTIRVSGTTATGWKVKDVAASEGTVTSSTLTGGFYATRNGETWQVTLTGYRILD